MIYPTRPVYKDVSGLKCPGCGRREFRFRFSTRDYMCRVCGTIFEAYQEDQKVRTRIKEQPL